MSFHKGEAKISKFHGLLSAGVTKISRLAADHHVVLGKNPNAIPAEAPITDGQSREVRIGFHPVAGALGIAVTHAFHIHPFKTPAGAPDPANHWGIIVGDYYHELNCDGDLNVIYQNGVLDKSEWEYFHIGETTYNDEAIRIEGENVINRMRQINPHYHILENNCQLFTLNLATQICTDAIPQVYTSWHNDIWEKNAEGAVATKIAEVMNEMTPASGAVDADDDGDGHGDGHGDEDINAETNAHTTTTTTYQ